MQTHVRRAVDVQRHDVRLEHKLKPGLDEREAEVAQLLGNREHAGNVRVKVKVDDVDRRLSKSHIKVAGLNNVHCMAVVRKCA